VITYVVGVDEDPQNFTAQVETLRQSGALVAPTNAAATRLALGILSGRYPEASPLTLPAFSRPASSLETEPPFDLPERANVINIGLSAFAESLKQQQVPVTHVDFHPPAGGNEAMAKLLADML
jgi:FdrA protein